MSGGFVSSMYKTTSDGGYTGWFNYYYDAAGRLTETTLPYNGSQWQTLMNKYSEQWTYDDNGNRTSYTTNGRTQNWTYDSSSNRLLSQSGHQTPGTYTYDAVGNITATYLNLWRFKYDDLNRVREIGPPGRPAASLLNNYMNHRVYKKTPIHKNGNWNSNQYNYFLFDASGRLVGEYETGTSTRLKFYIYFGSELVGYVHNSTLYFVHNDHLGRPELLTDLGRNVIWKSDNTLFGRNGYPSATQDIDFNIGFPGQYWDSLAEMWYNWHRYYDQRIGRYIQSDPIGLQGGMNTYAYVESNPLSYIDPMGLDFNRREFYSHVVGGGMLGFWGAVAAGCVTTGCVASAPAAVIGLIGGGVGGALANIRDQYGDTDQDGIPNHDDLYPGYPTNSDNDHDGDGIPNQDDEDYSADTKDCGRPEVYILPNTLTSN